MGFFDSIFEKVYTDKELLRYFKYEIDGCYGPEDHPDKLTTNIYKTIETLIKQELPNAYKWETKHTYCNAQQCNETVFQLQFKGQFCFIKDDYGRLLDNLYFDVTVYADKYAKLTELNGKKSRVVVAKKP